MSTKKKLDCGLIMPISAIDGCSADHWTEVQRILRESIESVSDPNFLVSLVSDADDVGVIQKRIVQNVYSSDIVVCDVSGKNPNVMFELGMRLAFDKPTVIVKDDYTDYSFDTGVIEHVIYPRDLRFAKIVSFKKVLAEKVAATYKAAAEDSEHSTFLKNFGEFHVANLSEDVVPADKMLLEMVSDLQLEVRRLGRKMDAPKEPQTPPVSVLIRHAARDWRRDMACEYSDLIDNNEFHDYCAALIDPAKHFDSRKDFESEVDRHVGNLMSRK